MDKSTQTSEDIVQVYEKGPQKYGKYVSVLYHRLSYQEGGPPGYVDLDQDTGSCTLVHGPLPVEAASYLPLSIIALVVFIPIGVLALDNSFKVKRANAVQDEKGALEASGWALQYALLAFLLGPLVTVTTFLAIFIPTHHM